MNGMLGVLHLLKAEPPDRGPRPARRGAGLRRDAGPADQRRDRLLARSRPAGWNWRRADRSGSGCSRAWSTCCGPQAEAKGLCLRAVEAAAVGWVADRPGAPAPGAVQPDRQRGEVHPGRRGRGAPAPAAAPPATGKLRCRDRGHRHRHPCRGAGPRCSSASTRPTPRTTRQFGGSGLGLAISRQPGRDDGRRDRLRSAEGRGSTFWFEIAAQPPKRRRARTADPPRRRWTACAS